MSADLNGAAGHDLKYAAAFLGLSKHTVRQLARRKTIAHYRLSRRLVFKDHDLEEYLNRHRVEATPAR
jgi:excisionase family DNA binding protein